MNHRIPSQLSPCLRFLALLLVSLASMAAFAGPGRIGQLPASVDPGMRHGFPPSLRLLTDAAELTASFNVGARTADTYPANLPFQILYTPYQATDLNNTGGVYTTFYVTPGTRLYVPVIYNDNSLPIIGDFPPAGDRSALLYYMFSQDEFGLVSAKISIDGQTTTLGPDYVVEVAFDTPLPDGATLYQTVGALLTPLKKGTHTVEISALATGDAFSIPPIDQYFPGGVFSFSLTYTVVVQ